jgi:serine/threonine protein phosphatase PrpC
MEDRHVAAGELGGDPKASFYAVFDGHGGEQASE